MVLDGYLFAGKGIFDIETGELAYPIRLTRGYYQSLVRTRQHVFSMPGSSGGRRAAKRPKLTQNAGARIKGGHLSADPGRVAAQFFGISLNSLWEGYAHEGADIKEMHHSFIGIFTENPIAPVRTWARQAFEEGVIGWLNAPPVDVGWANNAYGAPPFCVGDRIYFRSRAFLYCLGDEAEAVPGDPVMAETIESSDDPAFLLTQLKAEQAPYRLRAARRLGELKHVPALDALEAVMMVTTESAAVRRAALFSIQATAEAPTRATTSAGKMIGAATAAKKWNNFTVADVVAVFKPLDKGTITTLLQPLLATDAKDDKQRAAVIGALEQLGCATEPVRQGLLALLDDLVVRKQGRSPSAPAAVQALTTLFFNDPDVHAKVREAFEGDCGAREALPYLLARAEDPGALLLSYVKELPVGYMAPAMLACEKAVAHEPEIPGLYPALRKRLMAGDYCVPRTIRRATNQEKARAMLLDGLTVRAGPEG